VKSGLGNNTASGGKGSAPVDASVFAHFADATDYALIIIDSRSHIIFANRAAEAMFGRESGIMAGQDLQTIIPQRLRSAHAAGVARIEAGLPSRLSGRTVEVMALRSDGSEFPVEIAMSAWQTPGGLMMGGLMRDVSERRQRDLRIGNQAKHDPLTGLPNHVSAIECIARALNGGLDVSTILIDLDGLKKINEDLGHDAGDTVLHGLAVKLPMHLPTGAILARLGGSMLAVILPGVGDPMFAVSASGKLLEAVNSAHYVGEHVVRLNARAGIAIGPAHGVDAEELLAAADLALSNASGLSSGQRLFEPTMRGATAARRAMYDDIRRAVAEQELELHFQPQVTMPEGQVVGAEALLRWRHPKRGLLLPGAFLPALESHSLSTQVGDWIIDEACRQVAFWRRSGLPSARVSVNLFSGQLRAAGLPKLVMEALRRHNLPPESLELEVTETTALHAGDSIDEIFRELRNAKVRIAFDDFGTGHASLSLLKRFPITTLKIDRSFVSDITHDRFDGAIVQGLLGMARTMGLDVIAEGIETASQEAVLVDLGCRFGQGYRYAKALPPADFLQFATGNQHALQTASARS